MEDIKSIANKISKEGGTLYLVGGAVRDSLLGKKTHDEDYCVTGITFEKFQKIFPEAHIRGKAFSVFDIDGKEFALARTESKLGKGHKEFEINADSQITIEEDLARRDITINAIAKEVLTGKIIDPFKGQFVKKIADSILAFENGEVYFYKYGYDEYLEKSARIVQITTEENVKKKETKKIYNIYRLCENIQKTIMEFI